MLEMPAHDDESVSGKKEGSGDHEDNEDVHCPHRCRPPALYGKLSVHTLGFEEDPVFTL
jgi:hypothetical protein